MECRVSVCFLIAVAAAAGVTWAFNVDTITANVFTGPPGSMFGFSVALHKENSVGWILVGAPEAQTAQPGVAKGGAVYRCRVDGGGSCEQIPFDRNGSKTVTNGFVPQQSENKSHQWFGASVQSSGENGIIVACAPRYIYFAHNHRRRDPVGTCWISKRSFSSFEEYSPCRISSAWGYHQQGSCQAGLGLAVTKDGKRLYVGGVGSWYWQGQVFSYSLEFRDDNLATREGPKTDDDSYLGYSLGVGDFDGDSVPDVVAGVPRGNNLTGKVAVYNSGLFNLFNISGEQMGSYFGYAVTAADVDGNGLADIIVGAPLFTDEEKKGRIYEEGRVYIFYQNEEHQFHNRSVIDGNVSKGRFGFSLSSLGDINQDGFEDFAVGAPYSGEDGGGAVFIYLGSKKGVYPEYSQMITPRKINEPTMRTFGFSVSGGLDMDGNFYPDLVVGAYSSNSAVALRSRPVVDVKSQLTVDPEGIVLEEKKGCKLPEGQEVTCILLRYCLQYTGKGVARELDVEYEVKLDAAKAASRAFFQMEPQKREKNFTVRLTKDTEHCQEIHTYVQNHIRDKLHPIEMKVTHFLVDPDPHRRVLKPILNKKVNESISKSIAILQNCGPDNVCIPDLVLTVDSSLNEYLIGDKTDLELEVEVFNKGEDAFETNFYLALPMDVHFRSTKSEDYAINCKGAHPDTGVNELICEVANPLPANAIKKFRVILSPSTELSTSLEGIQLVAEVNSTNEEEESTLNDNKVVLNLPVQVSVDLFLRGISKPADLTHNVSHYMPKSLHNEADVGPEVLHKYEISNKGPSDILAGEILILWPAYDRRGQRILYLMDVPDVKGNATCSPPDVVNDLDLRKVKKARDAHEEDGEERDPDFDFADKFQRDEGNRRELDLDRLKRELVPSRSRRASLETVDCNNFKCTRILCQLNELPAQKHVVISLRSRLWTDSLNGLKQDEFLAESKIAVKVTQLPYGFNPDIVGMKVQTVATRVSLLGVEYPLVWGVPWWAILLAVLLGLIFLIVIIVVLIKCGFFKRKKVEEEPPEKEPLRQNGYQLGKGEEAL